MLAFLVTQKEGDTSMSNSDGSGGRELRLVLAVNDFEHFLSAIKGLSVLQGSAMSVMSWRY